jgi:hypothetical protein
MLWRGTAQGATIFNTSDEDKEMMAPAQYNTRFFRLKELRDAQQLKQYLRKPASELQAQLQNILKREEEEKLRAEDPLRRAIYEKVKSTAALQSKLGRLLKNHTAEELAAVPPSLLARVQTTEAPREPLAAQRDVLLQIVTLLGHQDRDLLLFGVPAPPV